MSKKSSGEGKRCVFLFRKHSDKLLTNRGDWSIISVSSYFYTKSNKRRRGRCHGNLHDERAILLLSYRLPLQHSIRSCVKALWLCTESSFLICCQVSLWPGFLIGSGCGFYFLWGRGMFAVLSLLSKSFLITKKERTNYPTEQPAMYFLSSDKKYQKADLGVFP